jgi:hypothetical protein
MYSLHAAGSHGGLLRDCSNWGKCALCLANAVTMRSAGGFCLIDADAKESLAAK